MTNSITDESLQDQELIYAHVHGVPVTSIPHDLYIPPEALEIILEAFEGPLDLLLYLIKKQNLDVLNIPIAEITRQYMEYVELMKHVHLELAGEYLVMAAMLAEIKSRMLLPRPIEEGQEEDPRAELVRRLQEYEQFKKAALDIDNLPQVGRDIFPVTSVYINKNISKTPPAVEIKDILLALQDVVKRGELFTHHHVKKEALSVREKMGKILTRLSKDSFVEFANLFEVIEGRRGIVVSFLAILELLKESLIELVQNEPFGPIHVKAV